MVNGTAAATVFETKASRSSHWYLQAAVWSRVAGACNRRQYADSLANGVDGMSRLVMNFKFGHRFRIISQWTRTNG
jgi:hypothetical protein